jgi:hypothetical protein
MFGKYNGFVSKARVSACMYFLVVLSTENTIKDKIMKIVHFITENATSFPRLQCEDEARHEEALVWAGQFQLHSDWLTPYCLKITELDS